MSTDLIVADQAELSIDQVKDQVRKIQDLMKSVMREGEHFGTIPGTDKPSLYKAGAEKLGFVFRLIPGFEVTRWDLPNDHREYEVLCILKHLTTGAVVGQGVGNCSTMESKYRWRYLEESTGKPVPASYWKIRKKNPKGAQTLIGGPGFRARKIDGDWVIIRQGERVENPDIADQYNTILKMSKKRAHVDAIITACAASDIFSDLEDLLEPEDHQADHQADHQGGGERGKPPDPGLIRQDLIKEIGELMKDIVFTDDDRDKCRQQIKKAGDNKALVKIKQRCAEVLGIRKRQAEEVSRDPTLDQVANEGWNQ